MKIHKNARLTPSGREPIVRQIESGQTPGGRRTSRRPPPAHGSKKG